MNGAMRDKSDSLNRILRGTVRRFLPESLMAKSALIDGMTVVEKELVAEIEISEAEKELQFSENVAAMRRADSQRIASYQKERFDPEESGHGRSGYLQGEAQLRDAMRLFRSGNHDGAARCLGEAGQEFAKAADHLDMAGCGWEAGELRGISDSLSNHAHRAGAGRVRFDPGTVADADRRLQVIRKSPALKV